ncbi:hypothetical protein ACIQOV_36245 [Kitasatospora sp. NPDC091257]|uniref:hypothetical protein n=1 Tax=Kitasatospora sp. NPDC091257 TaxID=3364084 RepID=UPI003803612B
MSAEGAEQVDVAEQAEVGCRDRAAGPDRHRVLPGLGRYVRGPVDDHREHGAAGDADQDRAADAACHQHEDRQQGDAEDEHRPAGQRGSIRGPRS